MKHCSGCGQTKPLTDFHRRWENGKGGKPASAVGARVASCKKCWRAENRARYAANRDRYQATRKAFHAANPEQARYNKMKSMYGLSREEVDALPTQCVVCGVEEKTITSENGRSRTNLAVDHDHTTNRVRGRLCLNCNAALGMIQDDPMLALRLAIYLLRDGFPEYREEFSILLQQ